MIRAEQPPINVSPLTFITELLKGADGEKVCAIFPSQRSLREATYNNFKTIELFSISEFTRYASLSKGVHVPKNLRPFYLKLAIEKLNSTERLTIFKSENNIYLQNFLSFVEVSSSIFMFYRELAAEMISTDNLLIAGKYSDHDEQIKILDKLWNIYIEILGENGLVEEWEQFKEPKINYDFIDRYDKFIFLIGGYLTKYELSQLEQVGRSKDVTLIFTYVGEKHKHHFNYEKALGIELKNTPIPKFPADRISIYSSSSLLGQLELISKYIIHLNSTMNIDFSKMAVVIPNESIKSYFLRADKYNLFDISSNEDIEAFETFQVLNLSIDIINDLKVSELKNVEIEKIITTLSHTFIKDKFDTNSAIEKLYKKILNGAIYIPYSEIIKLPFFSNSFKDFSNVPYELTVAKCVTYIINFMKSFENLVAGNQLIALNKILIELESYKLLYKSVSLELPFFDILSLIIKDISALRIQTPKGRVAVMGILESRNLDFEVIFIPELNETIFPPINQKDLYLNTEIRLELDLPTFIDRENLLKNYLLQIMSQAKVSILTYSDNPNRRRRSRFIEELIINNNIKVKSYSPKVYDIFTEKNKHLVNSYELEIEKNDEIIRAINSLELSATSFNDYISCTLKFYFSRILKQKAFAEPELKISAATIGNAFHKALEKLVNSKIEDIKEFIQGFEQIFYDELSSHDAFKYSLAQKFVAKEACKAIPDIARTHFLRLNEGWETIQTERVIVAEHLGFHLKGLIDRVDKNNNNYEIIDYKFKTLQPAYEKIDFEKQTDLQTPFYAFLFEKNNDIVVDNLYHFDLKNTFKLEHSFYMSNYEKFKIFLNEKLDELKNKDAKFVKTNKIKACEYCEFATLCGRA